MDEYCQQNGFAGWFETSAKENTNIDESAKALVSKVCWISFVNDFILIDISILFLFLQILINDKLIHNDMVDGERLILNAEDVNKPKKFCSC